VRHRENIQFKEMKEQRKNLVTLNIKHEDNYIKDSKSQSGKDADEEILF